MNIQLIENQTVATLRNAGYKVKVLHERFGIWHNADGTDDDIVFLPEFEIRKTCEAFVPKGGKTTVIVTEKTPYTPKQYRGVSICSNKDSFNRKRRVQIALARLNLV